jgi:hypothetical protein
VLKTKSFNIIDEGIDQTKFKRPKKYIEDQAADPNAPQWYSEIICHKLNQPFRNIPKEEIYEFTPTTQTTLNPNRLIDKTHIISADVYVDGSYKDGEMGSAALFHSKYADSTAEIPYIRSFSQSIPSQHNASVNLAEKWSFLKGLEPFDSRTKLNIYSDSDSPPLRLRFNKTTPTRLLSKSSYTQPSTNRAKGIKYQPTCKKMGSRIPSTRLQHFNYSINPCSRSR